MAIFEEAVRGYDADKDAEQSRGARGHALADIIFKRAGYNINRIPQVTQDIREDVNLGELKKKFTVLFRGFQPVD